ncbi:MAG: glycosyltransferase family 1 protein [Chloroflexi bacterium]|nr:glycosyltransferase family 1 protein [Chloroflexota bacterium]
MPPTVTLLTSGTRGDVQPYVALGLGLQAAGWRVVVATHPEFRSLVEGYGLTLACFEGNPSEWMTRPGGQSALTFDGDWRRSARATLDYLRAVQPLYARMLASAWQACQGADLLLFGLPTLWGAHIAEALRVISVPAFLQPIGRSRAFPSALLPTRLSLGPAYNWLTHWLVEQAVWQPWRALINQWRRETLRLPPAPFWGLASAKTILYGYSSRVAPKPADWPASYKISGYWLLDEDAKWTPSDDLLRFIETGSPPLFVGFGSPGLRWPQETLAIIIEALKRCGLRAVMTLPPVLQSEVAKLPTSVFPAISLPHDWLFPRLAAVCHHGGAGTTAAGLRAGLPTLIMPMAIDQFFWGERVQALDVGPRPLPLRSLTVEKLAPALDALVHDESMQARAKMLGQAIRAEDGVKDGVAVIGEAR